MEAEKVISDSAKRAVSHCGKQPFLELEGKGHVPLSSICK